jgi:hypothetical protein
VSAPKWSVGMCRTSPGIYLDKEGTFHFDLAGLCEHFGVEPTEENQAIVERGATRAIRENLGAEFPIGKTSAH